MKTAAEIRDSTEHAARQFAGSARKTAYAVVGAPVVAGRRIAEARDKVLSGARKEFDLLVAEGERLAAELRERRVVSDLREKVDLDHLQDQVERLRDRLEDALASWRESFPPDDTREPDDEPPPAATE